MHRINIRSLTLVKEVDTEEGRQRIPSHLKRIFEKKKRRSFKCSGGEGMCRPSH